MIQLKPIGIVRNTVTEAHRETRWDEIESEIIIDAEWRDALDGLAEFSHIWVIFYLDRVPAPDSPYVHPMSRSDLPLVGRLATRSPSRPNPIGICAVELLAGRGSVLHVRGLDALDGTPVLDLKPYLERGDAITNTRAAAWIEKRRATSRAK